MNTGIVDWLLEGPEWMRYAVELQLLEKKPSPRAALQDGSIRKLVQRLKDNKVGIPALKSGKVSYAKAGNAYWDLFFLGDIGFNLKDLKLEKEAEKVFDLQAEDGTFMTEEHMKPVYFCISSIIISSLARMGLRDDPRIRKYIQTILNSQRLDGGWHCAKNRAVGKKLERTESCPMDNLNVLMLLSQFDEYRKDSRFYGAIDLLLDHWKRRAKKWRPYGFGIGSHFVSLRYPEAKYGILRVLDVLSRFPYALKKREFKQMFDQVMKKSSDGVFRPESVVKAYSDFDFGQKKRPSPWITFLVCRIRKRTGK